MFQVVAAERRDIFRPFPEGRDQDLHHIQAVIEIFTEIPLPDFLLQIPVGGGGDPDVHLNIPEPADPLEAAVLQKGEKLCLHGERHLPDLVQEDGPSVCQFHKPFLGTGGAGEGAFFVTEKLGFQQVFRNGAAVDLHEGLLCPGALLVYLPDHDFLSGAGLAADQKIHIVGVRKDVNGLPDLPDGGTDPQELSGAAPHQLQTAGVGALLHAAGDVQMDLLQVEGLLHEMVHTLFHGFHSLLDGAVGGHEDDDQVFVQILEISYVGKTAVVLQPVVQQEDVRGEALGNSQSGGDILRGAHLIPEIFQPAFQRHADQ